jgi:hypothetical protein
MAGKPSGGGNICGQGTRQVGDYEGFSVTGNLESCEIHTQIRDFGFHSGNPGFQPGNPGFHPVKPGFHPVKPGFHLGKPIFHGIGQSFHAFGQTIEENRENHRDNAYDYADCPRVDFE